MDVYTGRPGAGKSYSVVEYVVLPSLLQGRHIITNIPLQVDDLISAYGGSITQLPLEWAEDDDFAATIPNGAVLILDEVWRRFPAGQKVTAANQQDLAMLKEHRHRVDEDGNAMRIVLVTQDASDIALWVRKLVDHTYIMEKLADVGADKRFRVDIYRGCPTGDRLPKKLFIRSTYGTYKSEVYKYYSSATMSETGMVGDETAADNRTNIWRSWFIWASLGGGLLGVLFGVKFVLGFFMPAGSVDEDHSSAVVESAHVADISQLPYFVNPPPAETMTVRAVQPAAYASPPASTLWRVVGYIGASADMPPSPWRRTTASASAPDPFPDYPPDEASVRSLEGTQPLVILSGLSGLRYIPLSDCQSYPDGINYYCDVDGERVTPWSGQLAITSTFERSAAADGQAVAAPEASSGTVRRGDG